ncbi:hypothetical protein [Rhizorhabdus dicambivorans]|uniref:hypothetical protein n=1 Tax=Rhizorhabdus dicambivorans TaxID=1850238 RepID=UPI001596546B|nr:hypothetical protein [Rhizorhabdus dicambivorans]
MDKPVHSQLSARSQRTVHAPQRHEGIGNALRVAFDPGSYGLPEDMSRLLKKMDR